MPGGLSEAFLSFNVFIMGVEVVTISELDAAIGQIVEQLSGLKAGQTEILIRLERMKSGSERIVPDYIPALEFMRAVGIRRWKFNQLVAGNMIKTVKKKRKIYVLTREVQRYFTDPAIQ